MIPLGTFSMRLASVVLVVLTSLGAASVGSTAASATPRWKTVRSNGIAVQVPATWAIEPYQTFALCPGSFPVVFTGVPARPVLSSCQNIPADANLTWMAVGAIPGYQSALPGQAVKIGGMPAVLSIQAPPGGLVVVTADFPKRGARVLVIFSGLAVEKHHAADLALALGIVRSTRRV